MDNTNTVKELHITPSDIYSIQNPISESSISSKNDRRSRQISQQIDDQNSIRKVVIISPKQDTRKESSNLRQKDELKQYKSNKIINYNSDTESNIFSLNQKKYGLEELINLDRVRNLMTIHTKDKKWLKDMNNVNKKIVERDPYHQSFSVYPNIGHTSDMGQLLNQLNDQPDVSKYTLKDIFLRTPTGPVFHKFTTEEKDENNQKQQFMTQFGGSIVLYFKTLKLLFYCMIVMSLLCQFQIILNTSLNSTDPKDKSYKLIETLLYGTSIAPIASINRNCNLIQSLNNTQSYYYQFSCPQGQIDVNSIIFGTIYQYNNYNSKDCQLFDPFLEINQYNDWKNSLLYKDLTTNCDGKKECTVDIISDYWINYFYLGQLSTLKMITAENVYLITVIVAAIYLLWLLTIIYFLQKVRENFIQLTQKQMVLSSMFSLQISPFNFIETKDEIKDQLWEFIENIVIEELGVQQDELIVMDINFSQSPTVYIKMQQVKQLVKKRDQNVALLLQKYELFFNLQKKNELSLTELKSFSQILPKSKLLFLMQINAQDYKYIKDKEISKIVKTITNCQQKIVQIVEEDKKKNLDCHQVDFAWITFDSIQKKQVFEKKMKSISCCKKDKNLKFIESYLNVKRTHASDNIIWNNLQQSKFSLYFRRFLSVFVTLMLFTGCNIVIAIFRLSELNIESYSIGKQNTFLFLIAIFSVDKLLKFVNKKLTKFEKYKSHSYESKILIQKLFLIELLNIVLICLISNFFYTLQVFQKTGQLKLVWVDQQFFITVVQVISLKLLIDIAKHPFAVFVYLIAKKLCQYYDRKFQGSIEISRKLLLEDWIELYTNYDFPLEKRYSQLLVTFYVAFLFGSAVPILFVFVLIYLFILFWVDKIYFLRFSKRPKIQESQQFDVFFKLIKHLLPLTCLANCVFFGSPILFNIEQYFVHDQITILGDQMSSFLPLYRDFFGITLTSVFTSILISYLVYQFISLFIKNPFRQCLIAFTKYQPVKFLNQYQSQSFLEFCNETRILKFKLNLEKKLNQSKNESYKQKIARVLEHIDIIQIRSSTVPRNKSIIGSFDYYQNEK